jgi:nicotinic acetylcholine receptor
MHPRGQAHTLLHTNAQVALDAFKPAQSFTLEKVKVVSKNMYYSCCPEPYPVLVYEISVQRQFSTFITSTILPLIIATLVSFTTLLMPAPISGSRPGLNIAIMFTTVSVYFVASSKLPQLDSVTMIARLYLASLIINVLLTLTSGALVLPAFSCASA